MMKKPIYKVPTMAEIRAIPWNGYNVASLFSGGGGSSTGYELAGFRVVYANEFIPAAQECYSENHPNTILDPRDIRVITPEYVLRLIGMQPGELDVLDGSPPCKAFSSSSKQEDHWGKSVKYSGTKQVVDDLFFEYVRLLKGIQPKFFVAENVQGLVRGKCIGYFRIFVKALEECGYNVVVKVLDAYRLGVPQARKRLIFLGARNDLGIVPQHPKPLSYQYCLRDAIPEGRLDGECWQIPKAGKDGRPGKLWTVYKQSLDYDGEFGTVAEKLLKTRKYFNHYRLLWSYPSHTVPTVGSIYHPSEARTLTIPELKRVCAFPDDYILNGSFLKNWERLGRAVPPIMMMHIALAVKEQLDALSGR